MRSTDPAAGRLRDIAARFHRSVETHLQEAAPYLAEMGVPTERMPQMLALIGSIVSDDHPTPVVQRKPAPATFAVTDDAPAMKSVTLDMCIAAVLGLNERLGYLQIAAVIEKMHWMPKTFDVPSLVIDRLRSEPRSFHKVSRTMWRLARSLTHSETTLRDSLRARVEKSTTGRAARRPNKKAEFEAYLQQHATFRVEDIVAVLGIERDPVFKILSRAKALGQIAKNDDGTWGRLRD